MVELEQLTIFDIPEEPVLTNQEINEEIQEQPYIEDILPYEIGDFVRVDIDSLDENDVLNYNYLLDFVKKKGIVKKIVLKPTLQYEVAFGDTIAHMYHKDLTI